MALQRPAKPPGPAGPCAFESHRLRLSNEPVAQMDESASLRSLRSHVRVVPGSFVVRGRLKAGRLSLK